MFFKRFYDEGLAQASYLIGCEQAGEAIVVDPNRDVEPYLACAREEDLRITLVTETHIHADFVSGTRELAASAGAGIALSGEGGADWQYAFAQGDGARVLRDGEAIVLGQVRLEVLHTPGHTPEHLAFLVTDNASSKRPVGLLSGDFVFVGDVGRPDLLERAANITGTMEHSARDLFRSLSRFRALADFVQVWPGHGAGSACGKALGAMPQSTVGYERIANWALAVPNEDAFVRAVLAGQPDPPTYFAMMKRINRDGPPVIGRLPVPPLTAVPATNGAALVIDVRTVAEFADGHLPGALNLPLGRSLATWMGWLIPYDRDVAIVAPSQLDANAAARELSLIGLDRVVAWHDGAALITWSKTHGGLPQSALTTPGELYARRRREAVTVLDVRNDDEWHNGHLPGALHIPLGQLSGRLAEIPAERPVVVQCQGGTRSAIAASVLAAQGLQGVENLTGGYRAWSGAGLPVEHDSSR